MKNNSKVGKHQYYNLFAKIDKDGIYKELISSLKSNASYRGMGPTSEECLRVFIEILILSEKEEVILNRNNVYRLYEIWKSTLVGLPTHYRISGAYELTVTEYESLNELVKRSEGNTDEWDFMKKLRIELSLALHRISPAARDFVKVPYLHTSIAREFLGRIFPSGESLRK